jgi:hypothetical protein
MSVNGLPIQGGYNEASYLPTFDFFKPAVAMEVTKRYGSGIKAVNILRSMGRERPVDRDSWSAYEENKFHRTITLSKASTAGTDTNGLACWEFTLAADDLDASNNFYPRVGFIITVPYGHITYQAKIDYIDVSSVALPVLYATPTDVTVTTPPAIASGTEMAITTYVKAAGTGQPDSVSQGYTKRTFYSQIIAESLEIEGTQFVNAQWFDKFDDGTDARYWWSPEFAYSEDRMDMYEEGMIVAGELNSQTGMLQNANNIGGTYDGSSYSRAETKGIGNTQPTSQGMFDWNSDLGSSLSYSDENWILDDLSTIEDYLRGEGVMSSVVLHLIGHNLQRQIDAAGLDLTTATAAGDQIIRQYMNINGTPQLAATLGFSMIQRSGFTHIFQVIDSFSNPQTFGASGYEYNKWGISFPISNVPTMNSKKEKVTIPNISLRYRARDGYNRRREMWTNGAAGGNNAKYQGQHDLSNSYWRGHVGLEMLKANQTVVSKPV